MYDVLVEDLMAKSSDGVLHEVQNFAAAFTAFAVDFHCSLSIFISSKLSKNIWETGVSY